YQTTAASIGDFIDRNLFERYGDVQAFGTNRVIAERESWYQVGSERNQIAAAANQYVALYCIYDLSMVVDLEGRVVAVNDRDLTGKPIDTAWMYHQNYRDEGWFQDAISGRYLDSAALTGTVVTDVQVDDEVKRACGGDGLVVGFSAPIKNAQGQVIGVWNNRAKFSLVEEIITTAYSDLKNQGLEDAQITLLNSAGEVLVDYAPSLQGGTDVKHDTSRILRQNLRTDGFQAAQELAANSAGNCRSKDPSREIWQTTGYAKSRGALGYPGLGWGVMVRVDESKALASIFALRNQVLIVLLVSAGALLLAAWFLARSISRPIQDSVTAINGAAEQVSTVAEQVANSSQALAQSSTENAASLEETSASMSEMNSMTQRNAENAQEAAAYMNEVHRQVEQSRQALESMVVAMKMIGESSGKVSRIIKTIDEIAFQTNILALNAAVEAARAGDAGMGFAVVADEVRNLAQRSAEAAKSTSQLIAESIQNAESGAKQVDHVSGAIGGITESVNRVKVLIEEVSMASKQQSQGFDQISGAVSQMEKVTQTIAATAEESAAAGQELTSQARRARTQVSRLQLVIGGGATAGATTPAQETPAPAARLIPSLSRTAEARPQPSASSSKVQGWDENDDDFFSKTGTDF
ncbi:MAG: methyl-accepting chemotaxis protein, partial [Candidatus Eisenbacteria bacterium]|nr:methyl-accepting chemotaxis protein [Candidatus Eisenbacteria bacterium]